MKLFNIKKYFIILTILLLMDCACGAYIAWWRQFSWNALIDKHIHIVVVRMIQFSVVALVDCIVQSKQSYFAGVISLAIRTKLTKRAWELNHHHLIEGGAQRVQEDCFTYPQLLIQLIGGGLRSLIMLFAYSIILIYQINWLFLFVPIIYAILGTGLAGLIAKPLISLNYINQVYEAKFRQILSKLNYKDVHRNNFNLFKRLKFLTYFQNFYNQITIIGPYCVVYSLYYTGKITFGVFMQIASCMVEIINSLSYIINSFSDFNRFLSCRKRLKEMHII